MTQFVKRGRQCRCINSLCKLMQHTASRLCLIVSIGFLSGCTHWLYPVEQRDEPELFLIETEDGAQIALHRFVSDADATQLRDRTPILFCHGIMSNRFSFDLIADRSFPRHLASLGYDVWMLELRNSGAAASPSLFGTSNYEHSMDAYIDHDVRTAIDTVSHALANLKCTGLAIAWVQWSCMGTSAATVTPNLHPSCHSEVLRKNSLTAIS